MRLCFLILFLYVKKITCDYCSNQCEWSSWESWSSCSSTCGGGYQYRNRPLCCPHNSGIEDCKKHCGKSSSGSSETRTCNEICFNGGTPRSGWWCSCTYGYYGRCCNYINACLSQPCKHDGLCINKNNDFLCNCNPGYDETKDCDLDCNPGPTDVIFLVDTSQSQTRYYNMSLQYMKRFTEEVPVSRHDFLFSVITYSTDAKVEFGFGVHVEKSDLLSAISNISRSSGATYTANALEKAFQVLSNPSYGVRTTGSPKYIIVLTDGLSTDRKDIETVRMRLNAFNIRIFAVGIGSQVAQEELLQIATSPAFVVSPESNDALYKVVKESVGEDCNVCWETSLTDIFILFDTSSNHQSKEEFSNTLDVLEALIKIIDIENTEANVCIGTFDEVVNSVFCMTENATLDSIMSKIQHIRRYGHKSDVISGLQFVRQSSFMEDRRERQNARKILIVMSTGYWDDTDKINTEISLCHKVNITVLLVGVGHMANLETMYNIASTSHDVIYVENAKDKNTFKSITSHIVYLQCNDVLGRNSTFIKLK